jgi:fimbrial chaperone protein
MRSATLLTLCRRYGAFGLLFAMIGSAAASTFNISPIRADLNASRHTAVLSITNAEEEPVVVEVRVVAWSQQSGEEQLVDTRELLATPPVMQIPANTEQVVRIALRREPDATQELTYRVIFEEVPQAAPKGFTGLRMALRLSIPVFVAPAHGRGAADMSWDAHWLPGGDLEVVAENHGTGHYQVIDFDAQVAGSTGQLHGLTSKYVLPGSRVNWRLKPDAVAEYPGLIVIHGHSDQGEFSADVANNVR